MLQDLLAREVGVPPSRDEVIPVDIGSTDPPDPSKGTPAVEDPPVVEDQSLARFQLDPTLDLFPRQDLIPLPRSSIPPPGGPWNDSSVIIVPSDPLQVVPVVLEHRIELAAGYGNPLVTAGVPWQSMVCEDLVSPGILGPEDLGGVEAVDEQGLAT